MTTTTSLLGPLATPTALAGLTASGRSSEIQKYRKDQENTHF
ncbi:hypothetical protein [Actinoplanes rectilineatus]|nr:hypothetical protein [Actinoplanes rectilineatus]